MKRILAYPQIYNLYQSIIGANEYLKHFATDFVKSENGDRILDLGCGTGNIIPYLANGIEYVGIDLSQKYINYDKRKYPNDTFFCSDICNKVSLNMQFDVIISEGVMVALTDEYLVRMFRNIVINSNRNTRIILSDSNYKDSGSQLEKLFLKNQRYKNFRTKDDYLMFIEQFFNIKRIMEFEKVYRIPYSKIVFECTIKD